MALGGNVSGRTEAESAEYHSITLLKQFHLFLITNCLHWHNFIPGVLPCVSSQLLQLYITRNKLVIVVLFSFHLSSNITDNHKCLMLDVCPLTTCEHLMMARHAVSALDSVIHIWWWQGMLCLHLTVSSTFDDGTASCICTSQYHPHLRTERQSVSALVSVIQMWWRYGKLCLHLSSTLDDGMAFCVHYTSSQATNIISVPIQQLTE